MYDALWVSCTAGSAQLLLFRSDCRIDCRDFVATNVLVGTDDRELLECRLG